MISWIICCILWTSCTYSSQQVEIFCWWFAYLTLIVHCVIRLIFGTWTRSCFFSLLNLVFIIWDWLTVKDKIFWFERCIKLWRLFLAFINYRIKLIPSTTIFTSFYIQVKVLICFWTNHALFSIKKWSIKRTNWCSLFACIIVLLNHFCWVLCIIWWYSIL